MGLPLPSSGNLPYPGIEAGSPILQVDSLLSHLGRTHTYVKTPKRKKKKRGSSSYWQYSNQRTVITYGSGGGEGQAAGQHMDNFQGIVMIQFSFRLGTGFISAYHWILKFHMIS